MTPKHFRLAVGWLPRLALALAMALAAAACARPLSLPPRGQPSASPTATDSSSWPDPPLTFMLVLDRQSYRVGEQVWATVTIRNIHMFPQVVSKRFAVNAPSSPPEERDLELRLTGPNRRRLEIPASSVSPPTDEDFIQLHNRRTVGQTVGLTTMYGLEVPGTYSLQLIYTNLVDAPDGREAWKGTLESNVVTFTIEP